MMRKGYVSREEWREEKGKKLPDYFLPLTQRVRGIGKPGRKLRACCAGFEVEELSAEKVVVFCFAPFIPTGHSKI